jgi:hypothetical protein
MRFFAFVSVKIAPDAARRFEVCQKFRPQQRKWRAGQVSVALGREIGPARLIEGERIAFAKETHCGESGKGRDSKQRSPASIAGHIHYEKIVIRVQRLDFVRDHGLRAR